MKPEPSEAIRGPGPPGAPFSPKKSRKTSSSVVPGEFCGASCAVLAVGGAAWVEMLTTTPTTRPASWANKSANGDSGGCAGAVGGAGGAAALSAGLAWFGVGASRTASPAAGAGALSGGWPGSVPPRFRAAGRPRRRRAFGGLAWLGVATGAAWFGDGGWARPGAAIIANNANEAATTMPRRPKNPHPQFSLAADAVDACRDRALPDRMPGSSAGLSAHGRYEMAARMARANRADGESTVGIRR